MPRSCRWAIACLLAGWLVSSAPANGEEYVYQFKNSAPRGRQFNIIAKVGAASKDPAASILFAAADKANCYRVDLAGDSTRIVKVDMGREIPIGTASDVGLSGNAVHTVIVKRRRMTITVALDGRIAAEAYDDTFTRGKVGVRARKGTVSFGALKMYDCGEVSFGDDFMTKIAKEWKPIAGKWSVLEAADPTLSANPFKYQGKGPGPAALSFAQPAGSSNWDNYSASVTARDDAGARIGLAFYCVDPENYHLFRLNGRRNRAPVMEILRIRDGKETVLADAIGGYIAGQFYRLRVDIHGTTVRAFIDDNQLLAVQDDQLVGGSIGLYTESDKGAVFDDVLVRDLGFGYFKDDFAMPRPGTYLELGGKWPVEADVMTATAKGPAKAVTGDPRWRDYVLSCDIHPRKAGAAGLVFYYEDELNHCLYRAEASGKRELIRYFDGAKKVLASARRPLSQNPERTVISTSEGLIRLSVDGEQIAEVFDPGLVEGRVGLFAEDCTVSFGDLEVNTPPPPEPVLSVNEAFKAEKTMAVFAADQRDWIPASRLDANERKWWWHRANLFGEARIELDMTRDEADDGPFQLALAAEALGPASGDPAGGYTLTVWRKGAWQLSIARQGKVIARRATVFQGPIRRIEFLRKGKFLFGKIDRKLEIWIKDNEPLRGSRAGYALAPPGPKDLRAKIYCPNLFTYTFSQSPVGWRTAAGRWEVTSRWGCDTRWSWLGGSARNGPAVIWNKLSFSGDFSLEFCGAITMDNRRGRAYEYARDMNATIAADGRDLTSGYSFIYGGWDNSVSCLTRKGEVVAKPRNMNKYTFSRSSKMHRQWWYFKIERMGSKLRWFIDNELALEYDDPEPLDGRRVALWAYDVGITVARVRFAAEHIDPPEHPGLPTTAIPKTVYDIIREGD